jgi:hypothetical protein
VHGYAVRTKMLLLGLLRAMHCAPLQLQVVQYFYTGSSTAAQHVCSSSSSSAAQRPLMAHLASCLPVLDAAHLTGGTAE